MDCVLAKDSYFSPASSASRLGYDVLFFFMRRWKTVLCAFEKLAWFRVSRGLCFLSETAYAR